MKTLRALAVLLCATAVEGQQYANDFQAYAAKQRPDGWVDRAKEYEIAIDPREPSNRVYGASVTTPRRRSARPADEGDDPRGGSFATYVKQSFDASGRFEWRGRLLRSGNTFAGVTFFSAAPEQQRGYLISTMPSSDALVLRSIGGATLAKSTFVLQPDRWTLFAIEASDDGSTTRIRAKFWNEGEGEPSSYALEGADASAARRASGRVGLWADGNGRVLFDDLLVRTGAGETFPLIQFSESGNAVSGEVALNRDARVAVEVSGFPGAHRTEAMLDGAPFTIGSAISAEGAHELRVRASDDAGRSVEALLRVIVDKSAPRVALFAGESPLGAMYARDVFVSAKTDDATDVTLSATLDGAPAAFPIPIAGEGEHAIRVVATDRVGWQSVVVAALTIDKTAPLIRIEANGSEISDGSSFNGDVALQWSATDLHLDAIVAELDGNAVTANALVTADGAHRFVVTATDKAGNRAARTRTFSIDRARPSLRVLANGSALADGALFNAAVAFSFVTDGTSVAATLDGQPYAPGTVVSGEGDFVLRATATGATGLTTSIGPLTFAIDRTPPELELSIADGAKFSTDVAPNASARDNRGVASIALQLNGVAWPLGAAVTTESREHTISATAIDVAGNSRTVGPHRFLLDKTKPVITVSDADSGAALDVSYARAVRLQIDVVDLTDTIVNAGANGTPLILGAPVILPSGATRYLSAPLTADGAYVIHVSATDAAGLQADAVTERFDIDSARPALAITSPASNALLASAKITVEGTVDDAASVTVNGLPAIYDAPAKRFRREGVALLEGANEIVVVATRANGTTASATTRVNVDTRAPQLTIASPAVNACLDTTEVQLAGTIADAALARVKVTAGATTVDATLSADRTSFTATIPAKEEGKLVVRVEAIDAGGHVSAAVVPLLIDRTRPVIEVSDVDVPFIRDAIAPIIRVRDLDSASSIAATLNGKPFASASQIAAEGEYELRVSARDCAGHASEEWLRRFTIDRTPPRVTSIAPADGATIAAARALTGTLSEPATLTIAGTNVAASVDGTAFTLGAPLGEGANDLTLVATDRAGNTLQTGYAVTLDTTPPAVTISIDGLPIAANAVYRNAVAPRVNASEPQAIVSATLNGQPFTSNSSIASEGSHTLVAKAVDAAGNESAPATATFRIDRSGPEVRITTPAEMARIAGDRVEVRGTITGGEVRTVAVNNVLAAIANGAFTATVPLDLGPNTLVAVALDAAGNSASDAVDVERSAGEIGLILTSPPDRITTNRPAVVVAGQVLTPGSARVVTINGTEVPIDAAGTFRRNDVPLVEGANTITAAVASTSLAVTVNADFTAPPLKVLANGSELADGARFAARPSIALETSGALTTQLTIDGEAASPGVIPLFDGGHALTAIARDAAGNESRVDRVFFIGAAGAIGGCALSNFDPIDGAAVFDETIRITGRSGGALAVLIDGLAASLSDGSFCGDAALTPGRNEIRIQCADAEGKPTADAASTLVIHRFADPAIAITSPAPGTIVTANSITVSGTVGAGVVSGDVNGLPFTVPDDGGATHTFSVAAVPVAPGMNVITARARTKSSRAAIATTRVKALIAAPHLAITSPLTGSETGAATLDVSGTYAHVDPATIRVNEQLAQTAPQSDTTGTFRATINLAPATTNAITVTARNAANAPASASVSIQHAAGFPSIVIDTPADNTSVEAATLRVTGTFTAEAGAQVQVNGNAASISGATFSADVDLAAGITPVIARVTTPDAKSASDSIRVLRFPGAFAVRETFPASDATSVDRGVAIVVLFNRALTSAMASGFKVMDSNGAELAGDCFVDRDAISFAPHEPLRAGMRYSVTLSAPLPAHSFSFATAASAPATAPLIDDTNTNGCFAAATITGRASAGGARVRLEVDGVTMTTVASDSGAFRFTFAFSGQSGYHAVRIREIGADGSVSPERALCYRINCAVPQVVAATLDRAAKTIAIQFSKPMNAASLEAAIEIAPPASRTIALNETIATVNLAEVPARDITLLIRKSAKDTSGADLSADYTQTFAYENDTRLERGKGHLSGAVYDATTGRPLPNAQLKILNSQFPVLNSNARGRYAQALPEGAYTIEAAAPSYTTVWRQIVVPAGRGVAPIDIRLTRLGVTATTGTLTHGGDTSITKKTELTLGANGETVTLTSVGGQSLAGLLPLGWSPLAAAEVKAAALPPHSKIKFAATGQNVSFVQYDAESDEWRVLVAVANASDAFDITQPGSYALVHPDRTHPPPPARGGAPLKGVANPCVETPDICRLTGRSFVLEPKAVLPSGRSAATLTVDGAKPWPSGTAVQAFIDEQLNLADGRVLVDPPFATDLLIYRTHAGDTGIADFHLAPSAQAQSVMLRDGVDRIRIVDYPGRIDRGTLVGAEGGRVPGDDSVTIDVAPGATTEPLHAAASALSQSDLAAIGAIPGFRIAGGFTFTLTRANEPAPLEGVNAGTPMLLTPARASVTIDATSQQVVIAEVLDDNLVRVAALMTANGAGVFTTRAIDSTQLPLDGIVRDGRYLVLVAEAPIAFAYGQVRHANGVAMAGARVTSGIGKPMANALGVRDRTRFDGRFVVPSAAKPAAPFSLVARFPTTGDGETVLASNAPDAGAFVNFGVLTLVPQPPHLVGITPADGGEIDAASAVIQATFDVPIDPASAGGLTLTGVAGSAALNGSNTIRFTPARPLAANTRYAVVVAHTVRGTNGAPFGQTVVAHFTTRAIPQGNTTIRRERIRITLPVDGKSHVSGAAGALPAGAQAIAVRRGRFFVESYQATVAADGSFAFDAGHRHASDRIAATDAIDLHVIDAVSRAIVAMIELTPFVSADGRAFLAPANRSTTFTSADNITVIVPAGAFEVPTMIHLAPAQKSALGAVQGFDAELNFHAAVRLDFAGISKLPIDVELPASAGASASIHYYLGWLGESPSGPRLELVDLVRLADGRFTTKPGEGGGALRLRTNSSIISDERAVRRYLGSARRGGIYATVDLRPDVGWTFVQGMTGAADMIWDLFTSLFVSAFTLVENRGAALIPVKANARFTIVGIDASNGLEAFRKTYDPVSAGPPINATPIASPIDDDLGPYPVFASPARIEVVDTAPVGVADATARGVEVRVENGGVNVRNTAGGKRRIGVINVAATTLATFAMDANTERNFGNAAPGDRVLIAIDEPDVEPDLPIAVVFNKPLFTGAGDPDAYLREHALLRLMMGEDIASLSDITDQVTFVVDSRGTRVELQLDGALQRGKLYALVISNRLAALAPDGTEGLRLLQRKAGGANGPLLPSDLVLTFGTRAPAGEIRATTLAEGAVRDFALLGNLAVVAALDGGLQTFDVADPAALDGARPTGRLDVAAENSTLEYWAVATDRHGRIYGTGVTPMLTFLHSYRVEDFIPPSPGTTRTVTKQQRKGNAMLTWRLGFSSIMPRSTTATVLSDRPEALPRKLQIALVDDEKPITLNELETYGTATGLSDGFRKVTARIDADGSSQYQLQRITVENRTRDLRWSADAPRNGFAEIRGIVARDGDELFIVRNQLTYGVVSLFGYGIGVFDLNAIDSNDNVVDGDYEQLAEKVVLSDAKPCTLPPPCTGPGCEAPQVELCPAELFEPYCEGNPDQVPCPIRNLAFVPEAFIRTRAGSSNLVVYALEQNRGVLDVLVTPPGENPAPPPAMIEGEATPSTGLALAAPRSSRHAYHPRMRTLHDAYAAASGREPRARFTSVASYVKGGAEYALIAAHHYGIAVLKIDDRPLTAESLVDVVWIPAGAYSIRVMPGSDLAVAVDGAGRVLLIDLKRIDQSDRVAAIPPCTATCPKAELFPTALASILTSAAPLPIDADWLEVGADDPRIVWKSKPRVVAGTLAPLVDSDTGFLYTGDVGDKEMRAVVAGEPRLRAILPSGHEAASIVPLGIESLPQTPATSAFRLEVRLPGAIAESLPENRLTIKVESERVAGAPTEQTIAPLPPAHLRNLALRRELPGDDDADLRALRYQNGFNRFTSPLIFAVADPRASKKYDWPAGADRAAEGCFACDRPAAPPDSVDLFTLGRFIAVHPDTSVFAATRYAYLGEGNRLSLRLPTVPADTVRPPGVLVAAQHPPVAGGLLQETTYVHSGEVETSHVDHDAGGRAGWNVVIDRTYRSRTIGMTPLGSGWDSSLFQRLRPLPNGDVEYRDGSEIWRFAKKGSDYAAPAGLYLRLTQTGAGYSLYDQQWRLTTFSSDGRMLSASDEFHRPAERDSGNTIRFAYDGNGRLSRVIDPVGRTTTLTYDDATGLLKHIADWHTTPRTIAYEFDAQRRLKSVKMPEVANTFNERPRIDYAYDAASGNTNDELELATNLASITDPNEALRNGSARVKFFYGTSSGARDRVIRQEWGSERTPAATFSYAAPSEVFVRDVLGQERKYTLTAPPAPDNPIADRVHAREVRELAVPVWSGATLGQLPGQLTPGVPALAASDRVMRYAFDAGVPKSTTFEGVRETVIDWKRPSGAPGLVADAITSTPLAIGATSSSFLPPTQPIARKFHYQETPNGSTFLQAIEAGGQKVESPAPHRNNAQPTARNDNIDARESFDAHGLLRETTSSGGTEANGAGARGRIDYFPATAALHARALPQFVREGENGNELVTELEYPSDTRTIEKDPRGVETTTDYDAWQRPVRIRVEKKDDPLVIEQRFAYDATGRLRETIEKKGSEEVVTSFTYDVVGRRTSVTRNGIATVGSVTTSTSYDLQNRVIQTAHPGGAVTKTDLDPLGRAARVFTTTDSSPIEEHYAYDLAGNRVYVTDLLTATASAYDAHGRALASRAADGTIATTKFDQWGRADVVKQLTDDGTSIVSESQLDYTSAGRLRAWRTKIDGALESNTTFAWDGGGRPTATETNGRVSKSVYDPAGRLLMHAAGAGNLLALEEVFSKTEVTAHDGAAPKVTAESEKDGGTYSASSERNAAGDVTQNNVGTLQWTQKYDELGNVTEAAVPGRNATKWDVDARGAVKKETLADGAENEFAYDPNGAQSEYADPTDEKTSTRTDFIGRPVVRTYADGTQERVEWEGTRVKATTDRQGRKQEFSYNAKGQLTAVRDGAGVAIEKLAYDDAGRLTSWRNVEWEVVWTDFDLAGNPKKTMQRRFRNASGLQEHAEVADEFVQEHRFNEHGERVWYSMPMRTGSTIPAGWTTWLHQTFDAMGNLTAIARVGAAGESGGTPILSASWHTAGRPKSRTVYAAGNNQPIVRTYDFDAETAQLRSLSVSVRDVVVAGSAVAYDGIQLANAQLLGVSSGERYMHWRYDERSRLKASVAGVKSSIDPLAPTAGRAHEELSPADFRNTQERTPQLDAATRAALQAKGIDATKSDPPTATFAEQTGHKIAQMTRGPTVRPFAYNGAERIDDGRFTYEFDSKGRLIRATEKAGTRVFNYTYTPTGRLASSNDALHIWDPITDRLIASYDVGGNLRKQAIHGDLAYDDPLEVVVPEGRLYPIFDEAATGNLQVVLNANAEVVSRTIPNDPYGAEDVTFTAPAIDGATFAARKNAAGELESIEITLHATDPLAPATLPTGAQLAALDIASSVVRVSPVAPTLSDPFTIRWTLTPAEWQSLLATPATTLSIAATSELRGAAWSATTETLPPPDWVLATHPVHTSPALPVEIRESLSTLTTFIAALPPTTPKTSTLLAIENLPLLGDGQGGDLFIDNGVGAGFQALPFAEPATGLVYVRDRWFDPQTGTWLSPDPLGYRDSSNLYVFAGGDPVNRRDPTGEAASMSLSGWIIATDNLNGGGIVKFSPEQIKKDPAGVRRFLGLNAQVNPREADAMIARAGHIAHLGNVRGIAAARRGTKMAEPVVNATATGLAVMSSFTGVGGAAQLTQAFIDDGATKTNVAIAGLSLVGLGAADDLVRLGAIESDNVLAIAETSAHVGLTQQTTQRMLSAGRTVRHHIFNKFRGASPGSQKYRDFFRKHAIDVDRYAVEIPEAVHQKLIHTAGRNWTTRWKEWIDANPDATTTEVYQFAGRLMDEYGLSGLPIIPYR